MTIRGVLFDLDDTLYDRARAFRAWSERFVDGHLPALDAVARAETVDLLVELDDNGYGAKDMLFSAIKARHPELTHEVDDLVDHFRADFPAGLALDAGSRRLLDHLREKRIRFGIITNGLTAQRPKLKALGIDQWTSCIFVSSEFGCKKPDPRIFRAAAAELGVPCADILFVGDHPSLDIAGAGAIGMKTAWVKRPGAAWPADLGVAPNFTVSSLDQLLPCIE